MEHLANAAILLLRYVCSFVYEGCVHVLDCHDSPLTSPRTHFTIIYIHCPHYCMHCTRPQST